MIACERIRLVRSAFRFLGFPIFFRPWHLFFCFFLDVRIEEIDGREKSWASRSAVLGRKGKSSR